MATLSRRHVTVCFLSRAPSKPRCARRVRKRNCSSQRFVSITGSAASPHSERRLAQTLLVSQSVHTPLLASSEFKQLDVKYQAKTVTVEGGRTSDYCKWWQEKAHLQNDPILCPVRLIGKCNTAHLFTPVTVSDIAFFRYAFSMVWRLRVAVPHRHSSACSKWGCTALTEHSSTEQIVRLVTPVETEPEIVHPCIHGLLAGEIKLSFATVESVLVLANAVGVCSCTQIFASLT